MGEANVAAVLADLDTAPISEPLRVTLRLLRKVTTDHAAVTAEDVNTLLAAGVTPAQVKDALGVCFSFNVITRLADTFRFEIPPAAAFAVSAKMLLSRGYKL
jgi:alkylhydroperoxidase family enzyme